MIVITVSAAGLLTWPGGQERCVLGRGGIRQDKREGDGATPVGCFRLRRLWYRADRLAGPPLTGLPLTAITPGDGWCDDPGDAAYNRPVRLPFAAGHERMWREDGVYDLVVELGYNDDPPLPGLGSAIFMHIAQPDFAPTAGCVALEREALLRLLTACDGDSLLCVEAQTKVQAQA